jgi:hypothetical protein
MDMTPNNKVDIKMLPDGKLEFTINGVMVPIMNQADLSIERDVIEPIFNPNTIYKEYIPGELYLKVRNVDVTIRS